MILYSEILGHVLTPFLDTYPRICIWELIKYRSAREKVVTGYQGGYRWELLPMAKEQNMGKPRDGD